MQTVFTASALALLLPALGITAGFEETVEQVSKEVVGEAKLLIVANTQATRKRSEFTDKKIPVQLGECTGPRYYKDALERQRVKMEFKVTYCKEKLTFEERADGTEGRGWFRRTKWVRIPGTEQTSYEYDIATEDFDLSYDPDSFRTPGIILRDLKDSCESRHDELTKRMLNERRNVRCQ